MATKVTNLTLAYQTGADNVIYATWSFSNSHLDHYTVKWTYATGDGVEFTGESSDVTDKNATYSPPDNAKKVKVYVTPVSTTYTSNGKTKSYWTGTKVSSSVFLTTLGTPETPSAPTVEVDGYTLTASLDNINDSYTKQVEFYVVKDGTSKFTRGTTTVKYTSASFSCTLTAGHSYKVCCRGINTSTSVSSNMYGDWGDYSDEVETIPSAVSNVSCAADSETSVKVTWKKNSTADSYEVEYTTNRYYFDSSSETSSQTSTTTYAYITGLDSGETWYFRVRAVNDEGESEWSDIVSTVLGSTPDAPTTWSSTTTAIVGENVTLYWVHNSADGSDQTAAEVELTINGSASTVVVGGAQILRGTNTATELISGASWADARWRSASSGTGARESIEVTDAPVSTIKVGWRITSNGEVNDIAQNSVPVVTGKTYTMSCYARGSGVLKLQYGKSPFIYANFTLESVEAWTKYSYTFTIGAEDDGSTDGSTNIYFGNNCGESDVLDICGMKLERGSEATDWSPAPEDAEYTSPTTFYELDLSGYSSGAEILWRVRTMGITYEYSDWSIQRTIYLYAPPVLTLTATELLESLPLSITAEAEPTTQTPTGYYISITALSAYETVDVTGTAVQVKSGEEVYSNYVNTSSNPLELDISAGDITLENGETYQITVTVSMDSGLTAEESATFEVSWDDAEYDPTAGIAIDEDSLVCYITPYCEDDDENLIEGVTLSVYRREFDGTLTELMTGLENTGSNSITDPHPALDYARYRIVAIDSSTGAVSYNDLPAQPIGEHAIIMQWDESWSEFDYDEETEPVEPPWTGSMLRLPYNIDVSESNEMDVSLVEYIGREHPVSYYGTQQGVSATWSCEIEKADTETIYALRRLARWTGDVYVREPSGTGYWAQVAVSMNLNHCELTVPVTFTIKRVEGGI